jgi:hypothetical protein
MEQHTVRLLGPSYLLFADETGTSSATAVFRVGTGTTEVQLSSNTFTQVGGDPIGGPELIAFNISFGDQTEMTVHPQADFTSGPYSWAVLQTPSHTGGQTVFDLQVMQDGTENVVLFSGVVAANQDSIIPPPIIHPTITIDDGAVYNDLRLGILNVTYTTGNVVVVTSPVGRGNDTGGLLTGYIDHFDIRVTDVVQKWYPARIVKGEKGLPLVVFGEPTAPSLAIIQGSGPAEIVSLIP